MCLNKWSRPATDVPSYRATPRLGQFLLILFRVDNGTDLKHFERIAKEAFQRISGIAQRARRKNYKDLGELKGGSGVPT